MRLKIELAYDGTSFHGWATQPDLRTVQGELTHALCTILRSPVELTVAGRTDAGVHARGQVVHLDVTKERLHQAQGRHDDEPLSGLHRRLNGTLPGDIHVADVTLAPPDFDARFAASWRRYCYRIADQSYDPLTRNHVLRWPRQLDPEAMNLASRDLVGENDFAAFCKKREGATTIRELLELRWERSETGLLLGTIRADAFCHNMVRALVGCLVVIGEGRRTIDWAAEVLHAGIRDSAITVLPARGLTLEEVRYPAPELMAQYARERRALRVLSDPKPGPEG